MAAVLYSLAQRRSKKKLRNNIKLLVKPFAFPIGILRDFLTDSYKIVQELLKTSYQFDINTILQHQSANM
jgi:hypothetical protein